MIAFDAIRPSPCWPAIVAAARGCVGTRFRPQGRVALLGLDCVGVALIAARAAGTELTAIPAYSLTGDHDLLLDTMLARAGCERLSAAGYGDLAVLAPQPGRRHLGIITPRGLVHAHAGLGQVVEGPLDPDWAWISAWRFAGAR